MNKKIASWDILPPAHTFLPPEIPGEFVDFLRFLEIPLEAYYYLDSAFNMGLPRFCHWNFAALTFAQSSAARFAQSIYKRGTPEGIHIASSKIDFMQATVEEKFTICDAGFFQLWKTFFTIPPDVILEPSEEHKSIESVNKILAAARSHPGISWQIFGGGIILDVCLFAADLLKVSVTLYPTTLLAMIDVAIGGKCGVNFRGKNQIGRFAVAEHIVIDENFLATLPLKEVRAGCAEGIKHALIKSDLDLAKKLANASAAGSLTLIKAHLRDLVSVKQEIILRDPLDLGERQILNFGHTVAHAVESVFAKEFVSHGEAVALGMVFESFIALQLEYLSLSDFQLLKNLISISSIVESNYFKKVVDSRLEIVKKMQVDKKNKTSEAIVFALPTGKGFQFNSKKPTTSLFPVMIERFLKDSLQWL